MDGILPWIFGALTLLGVGYFVFSIFFGELGELDADIGDGEFGIMVIAAFMAGFGAFGLLGTLSGWSLPVTLLTSAVFGYLVGKAGLAVLRFVMRQQTVDSIPHMSDLIGRSGRVTIDTPEGKTGEAMLEDVEFVTKLAVKEVSGVALKRGDPVVVVDVGSGILYVKKKNV